METIGKRIVPIVLLFDTLLFPTGNVLAYSFLSDEPREYSSGNCGYTDDDNRPDRTYPIRNGLSSKGWTGQYYTSSAAWPQDLIDQSIPGYGDGDDEIYGDNVHVTIFSGHGNSGTLSFSHMRNNRCEAGGSTAVNGVALGYLSGNTTAYMYAINCCYLNFNQVSYFLSNGAVQIMGYGGLSRTDAGMVQEYYNDTNSVSNLTSWLSNMEDRPYWFTGDNSAAILTRGWNLYDIQYNETNCRLQAQNCISGIDYPSNAGYRLTYIDHGCSGCDGC